MNDLYDMFFSEAYFGPVAIKKIQLTMDKIRDMVMAHPDVIVHETPLGKQLNEDFCQAFGFKSCSIYWSNRSGMSPLPGIYAGTRGPMTIPRSLMFKWKNDNFKYGTALKNGFYDTEHELAIYITTDQTLFTEGNLTSEEMVAILLHEVGHNFDHTIYKILGQWTYILTSVLDVIQNPANIQKLKARLLGATLSQSDDGRKILMNVANIDDIITNALPPISHIIRDVGKEKFKIMKILNIIFIPFSLIQLGINIVLSPINYIINTFERKGEIYADSFAASYGYATQLHSALDKVDRYLIGAPRDKFLMPFFDLALLMQDVAGTVYGKHGSTQQRTKRLIAKFNDDLAASGLSPEDKKEIIKERDKILDVYRKYISLDDETRGIFTKTFHSMVDSWYDGKDYMFIPNLVKAYQFAK